MTTVGQRGARSGGDRDSDLPRSLRDDGQAREEEDCAQS